MSEMFVAWVVNQNVRLASSMRHAKSFMRISLRLVLISLDAGNFRSVKISSKSIQRQLLLLSIFSYI